jgi:hypothetical protein
MKATIDDSLALIKYSIEYGTTHGGCPPEVKAVKRTGVDEARQAIYTQLLELAETFPRKKMYKVVSVMGGEPEELEGNEFVKAIPVEKLKAYFGVEGDTDAPRM